MDNTTAQLHALFPTPVCSYSGFAGQEPLREQPGASTNPAERQIVKIRPLTWAKASLGQQMLQKLLAQFLPSKPTALFPSGVVHDVSNVKLTAGLQWINCISKVPIRCASSFTWS